MKCRAIAWREEGGVHLHLEKSCQTLLLKPLSPWTGMKNNVCTLCLVAIRDVQNRVLKRQKGALSRFRLGGADVVMRIE